MNLLGEPFGRIFFYAVLFIVFCFIAERIGFFALPQERKKSVLPFSFVIAAFSLYLGILFLVFPLLSWILSHLLHELPPSLSFDLTSFSHILSLGFALAFLFLFCLSKEKSFFLSLWFDRTLVRQQFFRNARLGFFSWFLAFPFVFFAGELLTMLTQSIFPKEQLPDQSAILYMKSTLGHPFLFTLTVVVMIFIAPLSEEILFRGLLQNALKRYFSRISTILLTSLCFALFHFSLSQSISNIPIMSSLFLLSCFLGFLYEKCQSLIAPVTLHMTFNGFSIIQLFLGNL